MARTTTSAATSTYKPSGYAANPSAQNSSYTGSSYAAASGGVKTSTSTTTPSSSSSSYKPATGTTTASSYAAASGNTRSTYKPSSTTNPGSSSRTPSTGGSTNPGSSSRTPSTGGSTNPGGSSRTPSNPGNTRTPSNPGNSRTPSNPGNSRTPVKAPINGVVTPITPSPVQPTPSPIGGGERITLTIPEIEAIIQKLRGSESRLREIWAELINNYIRQIENSWAGPDAEAYIEKVKAFDPKIENIAQALSLLADTYQRVITSSQDVQQQVLNVVNNY